MVPGDDKDPEQPDGGISNDTDPTTRHAMSLMTDAEDDPERCSKLRISCEPEMLSCKPVAMCRKLNHPGCAPLKCDPLSG